MVIPTVVGILGPSVAALRSMFKALLSSEPWLRDTELLPLPFRAEAEYNHWRTPKLTFGVLESDGMVAPHPPIIRAIREVTKALEAEGHQVFLAWKVSFGLPVERPYRYFHGILLPMPKHNIFMWVSWKNLICGYVLRIMAAFLHAGRRFA